MTTATAQQDVWAFLEPAQSHPAVVDIRTMVFEGERLLMDLRRNPIVPFQGAVIDFNAEMWDFSGITDLPRCSTALHIHFGSGPCTEIIKLHLLCRLVWRQAKAQTLIGHAKSVLAQLSWLGLTPSTIRTLSVQDCERLVAHKASYSHSHKTTSTRQLFLFLSFYETYFGPLLDRGVFRFLDTYSAHEARLLRGQEGWQEIPDAYLQPLVASCQASLDDPSESFTFRVTAACILIASQVGLRTSELCTLTVDSLHFMDGIGDLSPVPYISFRTYKGARGNNSYRMASTVLNDVSLSAFRWLVETCAPKRAKLHTDALVAFPRQRQEYSRSSRVAGLLRGYVLLHHERIPSLNTASLFPGLQTATASNVIRHSLGAPKVLAGVKPSDTVVYPVFHQFRVTVATKLYEQGVDMRYIRQHMSHLSEDTTASYIRTNHTLERECSEEVYRSVLNHGAKLLGPHGADFTAVVEEYVSSLDDHVRGDVESLVETVAERFPLRRKLGGVCIRCGNLVPCAAADSSDEIYCAFGVCPNQCRLYYFAPVSYEQMRTHATIIAADEARGHTKAVANELRKLQNIVRDALLPELEDLEAQLAAHGQDALIAAHPDLAPIIVNRHAIVEEATQWLNR